jgi:hypothetical protein
MKLEFAGQRFLKNTQDIKFHENLSSRSQDVLCWQKEGQPSWHDEVNSHFHNFANVPKNTLQEPQVFTLRFWNADDLCLQTTTVLV